MPTLPDRLGIRFREIMSGHVAAGATDPKRGERAARGTHETFRFDLQLVIPSLDQFLAAPEHVAGIGGGRVQWRGQADDAAVAGGSVVLYRHDPVKPKRGTFEFYFMFPDNAGTTLSAHGQKFLYDDGLLDAGGDLSTVHLTVERDGQICGAGITRVHLPELLKQLQSMEVTGAKKPSERGAAKKAFFGFMNDELRRIYKYFPRLFPRP
jgi:hypothetical protein